MPRAYSHVRIHADLFGDSSEKDARIAELEAALAKAVEAIETVRDRAMKHYLCAYDNTVEEVEHEGGDLAFVTNDVWRPLNDALAAIKEVNHD